MPFRRTPIALAFLSLALLACAGRCSNDAPKAAVAVPKPRPDVRLLVLTDPKGYLEPCGCQQRPLGGVDKLAAVVHDARQDGVPTLLLAAGDITVGTELRPEDAASAATQEEWRAETLIQAYNAIGMTAVAPGKLDLLQPQAVFAPLVKASKFPWLLGNVIPAGALGTRQGRLMDVGGVQVGLLAFVEPTPALRLPDDMQIDPDLEKIAREQATEIRKQGAKVVIALVSGDRRAARSVAGADIDVVVMGGLDREEPLPPSVHDNTILVHAGRQGQRVVTLDLELDAQGTPHDEGQWGRRESDSALRDKVKELRDKIAGWEKAKNVDEGDLATQRARLAEMERELAQASAPKYEGRWFTAEVTELSPDVQKDKSIAALLDAYDKRVNEHNRTSLQDRLPLPVEKGAPHYVGSESCKSCHEAAYKWWRNTAHGRAYATLERVHKEFNLSCVGCHVTGYNQPGGSTVTHVENLKDVGCENCHGPGSAHNADPEKPGLVARDTPEAVCVTCHTHEHSDRFQYEAFKSLLIAPGHGLPVKAAP